MAGRGKQMTVERPFALYKTREGLVSRVEASLRRESTNKVLQSRVGVRMGGERVGGQPSVIDDRRARASDIVRKATYPLVLQR
jgi:hypothetical protein